MWIKPATTTKRGVEHVVPLSKAAVALRRLQKASATLDARVIPITGGQLRHAWTGICKEAGLEGVRSGTRRAASCATIST